MHLPEVGKWQSWNQQPNPQPLSHLQPQDFPRMAGKVLKNLIQLVTSTKVFNIKLSPPWQAPSLTGKFIEHGFEVGEPFKFYLVS